MWSSQHWRFKMTSTVNNQQRRMWKRNLIIVALILLPLIVLMWMSPRNQPFSNSDLLTLKPNTAASSVNDNQIVTMANIHCSSNEIQSYPDGESMTAKEIFRYLHWTYNTSCQFAVDFGFATYNAAGLFGPDGHKAICLDKSIAPAYNRLSRLFVRRYQQFM